MQRREFLQKSALAGAALAAGGQFMTATSQELLLQGKKALFVWGGWMGHEPDKTRDIFVPWMRRMGADVTVSDSLDAYTDAALMASLDFIVQIWTMGKIEGAQEKALLAAVSDNKIGLAGWHGGLCDAFRNNTEYQFMTGGQWVAHPGGVIDYDVKIVDHVDPVTAGLNNFHMKSEQYYMHVDPNVKVLATTAFTGEHAHWIDGCVMPVVWKKYYGHGRVFYSSLGHVAADFDVPEALTIMERGILWAAESKCAAKEEWIQAVYQDHG